MSSVVIAGDVSGSVTLQAPSAAGTTTLTLPATSGTVLITNASSIASVSGIQFPATQSPSADANCLDDYEEGTWSPTVSSSGGAITSYTVNSATYTKIGRLVNISFTVTITNNGTGSGAVGITLPFQSAVNAVGAGRENAAVGSMLQVLIGAGSATASIFNYSNGYPGGTNYQLICTLTYST